jgi:ATP-dependent DNA ligase
MALPVEPPLEPMLGRLVRELPEGEFVYEPKWDGFRCLAFRDGDEVDLRSRHGRPFARYFPEVVDALLAVRTERVVLDGELLACRDGQFDFPALMSRLHPAASRVARLATETPAVLVAFDLLARGDDDLRPEPFARRRAGLEEVLADTVEGPLRLTPSTRDPQVAREWLAARAVAIDGVMAKDPDAPYRAGERTMLKVKLERTADCVVAGCRAMPEPLQVLSLLLGLYGDDGQLHHVGVASGFGRAQGQEMARELAPLIVDLAGHPWERGFLLGGGPTGRLKGGAGRWDPETMPRDWIPLSPDRVCEVTYDQLDGTRLRHASRFRRWRPDREPESCLLAQLATGPEASSPPRSERRAAPRAGSRAAPRGRRPGAPANPG